MGNKKCPVCKKVIVGRKDKKFCSQSCKNAFHGTINRATNTMTSEIDKILHKNYALLNELLRHKYKIETTKDFLTSKGFAFDYCTGVYTNSQGKLCRYVYDYMWFELSNKAVHIKKTKQTQNSTTP